MKVFFSGGFWEIIMVKPRALVPQLYKDVG